MRPAGVRQRIQQLRDEQQERVRAHPQLALRRELTDFIHGCALLSYGEVSGSALIGSYRNILALLDDPDQQRTGSEFERACLDCVDQLRVCEPLSERAADPHRHATKDDEAAEPALTRIPPRVLVRRDALDARFPMACLNAAGSYVDGVIVAYRAATLITSVGYFEPAEERELLAAMRTLRVRYEDFPPDRASIADEIAHRLRSRLDAIKK